MTIGHLDSKQLVLRALQGEGIAAAGYRAAGSTLLRLLAGYSLHDYTTDSQVLAECVMRYYEEFRPDAVWLSADTWVTAEAMGAAVRFPGEDQPQCGTGEPLIHSRGRRGPHSRPRSGIAGPISADARRLGRIRNAVGDEVFLVACFDQYPFSLACELLGAERAMLCYATTAR